MPPSGGLCPALPFARSFGTSKSSRTQPASRTRTTGASRSQSNEPAPAARTKSCAARHGAACNSVHRNVIARAALPPQQLSPRYFFFLFPFLPTPPPPPNPLLGLAAAPRGSSLSSILSVPPIGSSPSAGSSFRSCAAHFCAGFDARMSAVDGAGSQRDIANRPASCTRSAPLESRMSGAAVTGSTWMGV